MHSFYSIHFLQNKIYSLEKFQIQNTIRKYTELPYIHTWQIMHMQPCLTATLLTRVVYLLNLIKPTLIHHYHVTSILHIRAHSWCSTFYDFWQRYNDIQPPFIYNHFISLKILCSLIHSILLSNPWQPLIFFTVSRLWPFPK